jgi:hypothetical protein
MCLVLVSEKKTATFALHNINRLVFITEVESVYCAVRTESLYKPGTFRLLYTNICTNKYGKFILKLLRHVSVLIHHLQGVYRLC